MDEEKKFLKNWVDDMEITIPDLEDIGGKTVALDIYNKFISFKKWAKKQIDNV